MIEVTSYPQSPYFGGPTQRVFTPAPLTPAVPVSSSTPDLLREMAFNASNYYSSSNPTKQPTETRSASVSSVSSSTSHPSPTSMQHGAISRTISPVPSMTDSGIRSALVSGSHYQQSPQHQSYAPQTHTASILPSPSQYFQSPMPPPVPLYSSIPSRQYSQSPHYGYQISSIPSQPSLLSMQDFHPLEYAQFAPPSYHSPPAALQPYQASPLLHYRQEVRGPSAFLKGLQSLPPHILDQIHKSFTYLECWQVYAVSRWFKEKFNPANLPVEDKIAGVRYAEQYYRRYFPGRASVSNGSGREYEAIRPGSFGCYHCFRIKGPEHFEQFKWNNHADNEEGSEAGSSAATPRPGAAFARSPPPKSTCSSAGNPHYDPSLTRSSVTAAANSGRRASRAESTGSPASSSAAPGGSIPSADSPRIKETWGIRRFCIDCGIRKKYYRPGDLIELCKSKEAVWVCQCWKIHWRPAEIKCTDCGSFIPLSTPNRRRGVYR
ncbi:hypothetical protein B0T21DRAFT_446739 [Apiosordaria backusii]|uniref:F-box domain-containing protein n=1 Tax=Apiosordaria backusii TaxID=314023 RepID=A0AA40EYU5_9PEZI|nr:hypothetical protein B0T21DRAFT_446739 [Apiosordaria backusii]